MTVSGYDSSSISTLFSSLGSSATSGVGGLTTMLSDYYSIKSGSYGKLLKSYYDMNASEDVKSASSELTKIDRTTKADSMAKEGRTAEKEASELTDALSGLMDKKLYEVKEKTGSDGKKTKDYDTDAIVDAAKDFVSAYNTMIKDGTDSYISGVAKNAEALKTNARLNRTALSEIGLGIKSDGSIKLDEDTLRSADMSKVQDIFRGSGSFGMKASSDVSMIGYYAKAAQSSGYTGSGSYNSIADGLSQFSDYV